MNRKMVLMIDLIQEITMGPFGSDIKVDNFIDDGVPVLNGSNIAGVKLTEDSFRYVSKEKAISLKKANTKRGDIVITHRGTLGQIAYIPKNSKYDNYIISQSQFRVTLKDDLVDPIYFTYYFHTNEGQKRLLSFKNHVGVPALAQATTNFRLLEFPYKSLKVQKQIAKVLSDLDTKIEINNKINQQLEAMAKTLYDYWFVQFDFPNPSSSSRPAGKPYKSSGGKMVFNEELKREIPEGWEDGTFETISTIIGGSTPSKAVAENFTIDDNMSWITPKDLSINKGKKFITRGEWDVTDLGIKSASLKIMPKGTVLLSSRAPIGYLAISRQEVTTNQGFKSFVPKENYSSEFIYYSVKNQIPKIEAYSSGSTFKEVSASTLRTIKISIPNENVLEEYYKISKPIFKKQNLLELENQKLSELRDWLLPMLMNGQVRVGEVAQESLGLVAEGGEKYIIK